MVIFFINHFNFWIIKNEPRYENHSDKGLSENHFLSYKKPQSVNTDTLIKSFDLKKVYQPFTYIHSDTL